MNILAFDSDTRKINVPGYQIIRELGKGSRATVYLALQESLDRTVALKILEPSLFVDEDSRKQFVSAVKQFAQNPIPHVATIYSAGIADGVCYITMQHQKGENLRAMMSEKLDISDIFAISRKMARALDDAHTSGRVHGNLKPENIFFTEDGDVVFTDFGINMTPDQSEKQTVVGQVRAVSPYMSPEHAKNKPLDARSDLYSLGVIFYEMVSGELPFASNDPIELAVHHVSSPVPFKTESSKEYRILLNKWMAKTSAERFQSGAEIIDEIKRLESGSSHQLDLQDEGSENGNAVAQSLRAKATSKSWGVKAGIGALILLSSAIAGYVVVDQLGNYQERAAAAEQAADEQRQLAAERARAEAEAEAKARQMLLAKQKAEINATVQERQLALAQEQAQLLEQERIRIEQEKQRLTELKRRAEERARAEMLAKQEAEKRARAETIAKQRAEDRARAEAEQRAQERAMAQQREAEQQRLAQQRQREEAQRLAAEKEAAQLREKARQSALAAKQAEEAAAAKAATAQTVAKAEENSAASNSANGTQQYPFPSEGIWLAKKSVGENVFNGQGWTAGSSYGSSIVFKGKELKITSPNIFIGDETTLTMEIVSYDAKTGEMITRVVNTDAFGAGSANGYWEMGPWAKVSVRVGATGKAMRIRFGDPVLTKGETSAPKISDKLPEFILQ